MYINMVARRDKKRNIYCVICTFLNAVNHVLSTEISFFSCCGNVCLHEVLLYAVMLLVVIVVIGRLAQ